MTAENLAVFLCCENGCQYGFLRNPFSLPHSESCQLKRLLMVSKSFVTVFISESRGFWFHCSETSPVF